MCVCTCMWKLDYWETVRNCHCHWIDPSLFSPFFLLFNINRTKLIVAGRKEIRTLETRHSDIKGVFSSSSTSSSASSPDINWHRWKLGGCGWRGKGRDNEIPLLYTPRPLSPAPCLYGVYRERSTVFFPFSLLLVYFGITIIVQHCLDC